ncbi:Uncharacterized protein Adt_18934 [Abeliophyllum distichum]|uniref:Uncharacterized protein n=1 Tax=Abeliophyllum distichum TaxID=126358 RepID=A0ABD1TKT2_9LAMI
MCFGTCLSIPSMGAQAVKKYFTPKWEEFSSHGKLEDVLEASLASAIRASAMQMKVLGEFRTRHSEIPIEEGALHGSCCWKFGYGREADLPKCANERELSSFTVEEELAECEMLELEEYNGQATQLDNTNAAQKVAAEALEAANTDKRRLLDEVQSLRENLESSENSKKEAKLVVARLMGEKNEMEENWGKWKRNWKMRRRSLWRTSTILRPIPIFQIIFPGLVNRKF